MIALVESDPLADWLHSAWPTVAHWLFGPAIHEELGRLGVRLARINVIPRGDDVEIVAVITHSGAASRVALSASPTALSFTALNRGTISLAAVRGAIPPSATAFLSALKAHFREMTVMLRR